MANKITLKDTAEKMTDSNYRTRFKAEYFQLKIRLERLKDFNTEIEASKLSNKRDEMPIHDCPYELLVEQEKVMTHYLRILEIRAKIEGVDLSTLDD